MDKDLTKGTPLSHDEKGQLQGGFQLQSSSFESHFFSDNGNCKESEIHIPQNAMYADVCLYVLSALKSDQRHMMANAL